MERLSRTLLWRRTDRAGLELFRLWEAREGWRLQGTVLIEADGAPVELRYAVGCTRAWETRGVHVELERGGERQVLDLAAGADRRWRVDGRKVEALSGASDVDLGWTPSTNTLPVCRLGLAVGEAREIAAAWVRFPQLTVEPVAQRYTRLDERLYRYENVASGFTAELEVDDLGLILRYPGGWERAAELAEGPR